MDTEHYTQAKDGTRLGYRIARRQGHKIAITMLHGLASNMTRWTEFVSHTSLVDHFDLLRIDLRGRGITTYRGRYDRQTWVDDIATIINAEAYEKTIVMGHSLGAQVAIEYALQHPHRAAGLVLIDPVFPQTFRGRLAIAHRLRWGIWLLIRLAWLMNRLGLRRRHIPNRNLFELDLATRERLGNDKSVDITDLYTSPFEDAKYLPLANYLQDLYEVAGPLADFSKISVPVLVLLSKGAALSTKKATEQQITKMRGAETVIIDANHWLLTEKPEQSRKAIETWILRNYIGTE